MRYLLNILAKIKTHYKIVLVYIAEAHADDVWPLGYGINQTRTLDERRGQCSQFLQKWRSLENLIDHVFLDNMENEFVQKTGCWPEGYLFANKDGLCEWKCLLGEDQGYHYQKPIKLDRVLNSCLIYARSQIQCENNNTTTESSLNEEVGTML